MQTQITGNKGEWSEIYVLLRLLSEGRIYAADENLQRIENMYFPILKIIREEVETRKLEYVPKEKVEVYMNGSLLSEYDKATFKDEADFLYQKIVLGEGRAFSVEKTAKFMKVIGCTRLSAPSSDKTDITMQIHDIQTGYSPIAGFSIKSEIGNAPTLINASGSTNFIFEVTGISDEDAIKINNINTYSKIKDRMNMIFAKAKSVKFIKTSNDTFARNLMLIDSRMPELVASSLLYHYRDDLDTCAEITARMEQDNPLSYPTDGFYTYKYKKFLTAAALGMVPATKWDGIDEANGGYIIVTEGGDVVAYHIYNRDYFEEYLLQNTRFERGSTSRHKFASLYKENNSVYLNLNLQIRFVK